MTKVSELISQNISDAIINYQTWGGILINVKASGAKGDGVADDTAAIKRAIAAIPPKGGTLYFPAGTYIVTDALIVGNRFVTIKGDGKNSSIIKVPISFPISALGVIVINGGEPSGIIRDIQITFDQLDTAVRANLYAFPPAIYARNQARIRILHVKVVRAMIGFDLKGNCGGAYIQDVEMSALSIGIDLDGSFDSVRIIDTHIWSFDLNANHFAIFEELATIGVNSGRVDDLHITDCLFYSGTGVKLYVSGSGATFGEIVNTDFDAHTGIVISGGQLNISNCNFTASKAIYQWIIQTGGEVFIGQCWFYAANGLVGVNSLISTTGTVGNGDVMLGITNCFFNTEGDDVSCIETIQFSNVVVKGCIFRRLQDIAYTKSTIKIGGGRLTAIGNRVKDKGTGAGNFIEITTDDFHVVTGNSAPAWSYITPKPVSAIYKDNNVSTQISSFRAVQTVAANQTIPITTFTKINFATEQYDNLGEYNPATSTFTASQYGLYSISTSVKMSNIALGNKIILSLFKNGSEFARLYEYVLPTTDESCAAFSTILSLLANDAIDIRLYCSVATTTNPDSIAVSSFTITKIG